MSSQTATHDHDHATDHDHDHEAGHSHRPVGGEIKPLTGAACASVAIDIGDGRGALVLLPSDRFRGREIEISRVDSDDPRTHTGVHERSTATRVMLTAIFGSLPAGEYQIWEDADTPGPVVEVPDGVVTEIRLG